MCGRDSAPRAYGLARNGRYVGRAFRGALIPTPSRDYFVIRSKDFSRIGGIKL